jgi:hypothetical protein
MCAKTGPCVPALSFTMQTVSTTECLFMGAASLSFGLTCLHGMPWRNWRGALPFSACDVSIAPLPHRRPKARTRSRIWIIQLLFVLMVAVFAARVSMSLSVRKLQTGSVWQHDYEWFGLEVSGQRMFPGLDPRNMSTECLDSHDVDQPPHVPVLRRAVDPTLLLHAEKQLLGEQRQIRMVHVLDLEHDLLTFLWDSILVPEKGDDDYDEVADTVGGQLARQPSRRTFTKLGIELVLEPAERVFELPPESVRNVLVIGSHYEHQFLSRLQQHQQGLSVGMITRHGEACRSGAGPDHMPLKFAFLTYGDCTVVDNRRFFVWPLGPSAFHGFPPRMEASSLLPADQRRLFLNLMVTFSTRKPTRMQAQMAAVAVCEHLGPHLCHLSQTNTLFKVAEWFDTEFLEGSLGTNFRSYFASDAYSHQLLQSRLTLCPSGNVPEQYRIWEAIIAGSIPVVEDPPFEQGHSLHPAFGASFGCLPQDVHRFLKVTTLSPFLMHQQHTPTHAVCTPSLPQETHAPVFFVQDWRRDLPHVIREAQDTRALLKRQRELIKWFQNFRTHLRVILLEAILRTMQPT